MFIVRILGGQKWCETPAIEVAKASCLCWASSGAEVGAVLTSRPTTPLPPDDVIKGADGDVTPGGRPILCWQLDQLSRNVGCCHDGTGMPKDLAHGGDSDEHLE